MILQSLIDDNDTARHTDRHSIDSSAFTTSELVITQIVICDQVIWPGS